MALSLLIIFPSLTLYANENSTRRFIHKHSFRPLLLFLSDTDPKTKPIQTKSIQTQDSQPPSQLTGAALCPRLPASRAISTPQTGVTTRPHSPFLFLLQGKDTREATKHHQPIRNRPQMHLQ